LDFGLKSGSVISVPLRERYVREKDIFKAVNMAVGKKINRQ
jgi:hypothetical protein